MPACAAAFTTVGTRSALGSWQMLPNLTKPTEKTGPKGIRLILMLDPLGKAYYWLLHKSTQDEPHFWGYGFYEHRRREQAILVHQFGSEHPARAQCRLEPTWLEPKWLRTMMMKLMHSKGVC